MRPLARVSLTFAFFGTCLCKVYESVADLPGLEYDFVIIGHDFLISSLPFFLTQIEEEALPEMWSQIV